jgi:hypothetical protein
MVEETVSNPLLPAKGTPERAELIRRIKSDPVAYMKWRLTTLTDEDKDRLLGRLAKTEGIKEDG